ncbi:hypothetical protein Golomagni_05167 [Golovinomyces magnicellulatus]|nr:hypothetical protein Golomagni_05167 [Golovinomyces magnicellulatus]
MGSRVERMQQRLRGVLREVRDVDFGLVFPTISNSRPPIPNSETQTFSNEQQITPEHENSGKSTPVFSSHLPSTVVVSKNTEEFLLKSTRSANANTSKKRKKLDDHQTPSTPSRAIRLSPKENVSQKFQLTEDDAGKNHALAKDSNDFIDPTSPGKGSFIVSSYTESLSSRITPTKSRKLLEVTESPINSPGSGKLIQTEELNLSNSQKNNLSSSSLKRTFDNTLTSSQKRKKKMSGNKSGVLDLFRAVSSVNASAQANDDNDYDELSPERPPVSGDHAENKGRVRMSSTNEEREQETFGHNQDENETTTLQENLNQSNHIARIGSPDLDLPIINTASEKQQRKKLKTKPQISDNLENINPSTKVSKRKSIIKNNLQKINTQTASASDAATDDDECDEFETLKIEKTLSKPRDLNYIDLLSQALRKIIGSRISTLQERMDACENEDLRRDLKTKSGALEAFGKEIKNRLLEHAIDLDYAQSLETRLRNEQKKKIRLRSEILRIRAECETISLRMDEIRKGHNTAQKENMNRLFLNNSIHNLELAIETARDTTYHPTYENISDIDSTHARLKKVAQLVSHQSNIGGLLRQVKDFNSLLERSAIALEKK